MTRGVEGTARAFQRWFDERSATWPGHLYGLGFRAVLALKSTTAPAVPDRALFPHLPPLEVVWEPACASGKMVKALREVVPSVWGTDISANPPIDFLECQEPQSAQAIITNPPYVLACEFIWHAITLMRVQKPDGNYTGGLVAMLLRTDFDHAKTRSHLFERAQFAKKVVLTKRIKWFEDSKGSPSFNHAWFIWDWKHSGPPTLAYGP
jgi:hypothetical protein